MARTLKEIKKDITGTFIVNPVIQSLYDLTLVENDVFENHFSKLSFESILFDVIAYSIWVFEQILGQHKKEVQDLILQQRIGTENWYKNKMLAFQSGFDLIEDTDLYDNTGKTDEQIEASKIITHAAVVESSNESSLVVKIATGTEELMPVSENQAVEVNRYLDEIRFAGTRAVLVNQVPDRLYLTIDIYRDPLVIDSTGTNILTAKRSVEEAINNFLKNELPFNGQLILQELTDALQKVAGVKIVDIKEAKVSSANSKNEYGGQPSDMGIRHIPVSGYYTIKELKINYSNVA